MVAYTISGQPRKRKKKKPKRSTESYLSAAQGLAVVVPKMKKYKGRKTLTGAEKSAIARRERQLKNIPYLVPLTKKQARKVGRKKLFMGGVQAIQLRGISQTAKITFNKKGDIQVLDRGQRWIYWALDRDTVRSRRGMRRAGADAFEKRFPIEKVSDLTAAAFKTYEVRQVHLWAHAGIVGDAFHDLNVFVRWVNEKWNAGRYQRSEQSGGPSDPGKWVNGIAILLENAEYAAKRRALEK